MIKDNKFLKKINNILNSNGTLLGLFKYNDTYYLSSYIDDNSGRAYCSVDEPTLTSYFNNELRLKDVFMASEDIVVAPGFRNLIKEQLAELIASGKRLFSENSDEMRNDSLAELFV